MTRTKTILAGIGTGMVCLVLIFTAVWHYVFEDEGPQILTRKFFISTPESLNRKTISSNVWLWPDSPLIEPAGIHRVDWQDPSFVGRTPWGYFVFYRARVVDVQFSQHLRDVATSELKSLASWATHLPSWWNPQRSVPSDRLAQLSLQSDDVFIEETGGEVFIYWIRAPYEGYI